MATNDITFLHGIGLTEESLLTIRAAAHTALSAGKRTVSFSIPGLSATHDFPHPPEVLAKAATYALQRLDPVTYGRHLITRRTYSTFR